MRSSASLFGPGGRRVCPGRAAKGGGTCPSMSQRPARQTMPVESFCEGSGFVAGETGQSYVVGRRKYSDYNSIIKFPPLPSSYKFTCVMAMTINQKGEVP